MGLLEREQAMRAHTQPRSAVRTEAKVSFPEGKEDSLEDLESWMAEFVRVGRLTGGGQDPAAEQRIPLLVSCWPESTLAGKALRTLQRSPSYMQAENAQDFETCWRALEAKLRSLQKPSRVRRRTVQDRYRHLQHKPSQSIRAFHEEWDATMLDLQLHGVQVSLECLLDAYRLAMFPECGEHLELHGHLTSLEVAKKEAAQWWDVRSGGTASSAPSVQQRAVWDGARRQAAAPVEQPRQPIQ